MNTKLFNAKTLAFIFALSIQINAQISETSEPETNPVVETPAPEPAQPVQPEPQIIQPMPIQPAWAAPAVVPEEDFKRHEIKIDILYSMFSMLKFGYEYLLSYRNALALTMRYSFSKEPEIKTQSLGSYKLYLLKAESGPLFFIEPDIGYTQGYVDSNKTDTISHGKKLYSGFTAGISAGFKFYIPTTNVGFETSAGINRLYGRSDGEWLEQFGVNLAWKF
jgi:hypothetical protein